VSCWAVDLIDMQHYAKDNDNFRFILAVIDVFSKFDWMRALKNKTGVEVAHALNDIITSNGRRPVEVWRDKGTEFYNRHVKKLLDLISSENEQKSSVVERWNLTMKQRMFKYSTASNTRRYVDVLSDMVSPYNNIKHSAIKQTPVQASNPENSYRTYMNLCGEIVHDNSPKPRPKFAVGDKIRITVKKNVFRKGYLPRWTEELFTVSAIQYTDPITYKIKDLNGEEIKGTFYEQEMQKCTQDTFRIERVLKTKGNKLLVKWMGYSEKFNSWVNKNDVEMFGNIQRT
jgi:hypothetical protein